MPLWVRVSLGASLLPVLLWPWAVSRHGLHSHDTPSVLLMIAPLFAALCVALAARSHRERPYITWLLIAVLWLSYAALAAMVLMPMKQ